MRKLNSYKDESQSRNIFQTVLLNHVETKNKRGYFGKPRYCKNCKAYKVNNKEI